MYAIVEIAGQQFKVEAGMEIFVNRLAAEKGAAVEFDKVLLIDQDGTVKVGAPYVEGAKVTATVLDDTCKARRFLFSRRSVVKVTRSVTDTVSILLNFRSIRSLN